MILSHTLTPCQDAGPRPLELTEVFKLFQIKYNRTYSNEAGIMSTDVSSPIPSVYLRDDLMAWEGEKTWPRPEWEAGPAVYALASPRYDGPSTCDSRPGVEDHRPVIFQSANP